LLIEHGGFIRQRAGGGLQAGTDVKTDWQAAFRRYIEGKQSTVGPAVDRG